MITNLQDDVDNRLVSKLLLVSLYTSLHANTNNGRTNVSPLWGSALFLMSFIILSSLRD